MAHHDPVHTGLAAVVIIVLAFYPAFSGVQAQTTTTSFTSADRFSIPELHGSISFWLNGSYSSTTLENNAWVFADLSLNGSQPIGTLKISAENSNVTVYSFRTANVLRGESLRYFAEGQGKQIVNLGVNASQRNEPTEWMVTLPGGVFVGQGNGWGLLPDSTVVITGLTGNVTVSHFYYDGYSPNNGPSIILLTGVVLAVVIVVAVAIKVKRRA